MFGKPEVVLESKTQIFYRGNLVEVHSALPCFHLVNVLVVVVSHVHLLTFSSVNLSFHLSDYSSSLSMSLWRSLVGKSEDYFGVVFE